MPSEVPHIAKMASNFSLVVAVLASALLVVWGSPTSEVGQANTQGVGVAPHLVGGQLVASTKREYYVAFRVYKDWHNPTFCNGVRLNNKWMLTAAECLDKNKFKEVRITAVRHNAELVHEFHNLTDMKVTLHPKYDATTKTNNIALVRSFDESWNHTYRYPKLPAKNENVYSKYSKLLGLVTGHVTSKNPVNGQEDVFYETIAVRVSDPSDCLGWYDPRVPQKDQICTIPWFGLGLDQNDLGAPIVMNIKDRNYLLGLALRIRPRTTKGQPAVFENISPYLAWIRKVTGIRV